VQQLRCHKGQHLRVLAQDDVWIFDPAKIAQVDLFGLDLELFIARWCAAME
jgi:hypothetical protein